MEFPAADGKQPSRPFVELIAPRPAALEDCVIEFESAGGGKMRIHWKAAASPDWAGLLRAWRYTEG